VYNTSAPHKTASVSLACLTVNLTVLLSSKLDGTAATVSGVLFAKTTPAGSYTVTHTGTSGQRLPQATRERAETAGP